MRTIERSSIFKKDYKREAKGKYQKTLDKKLIPVLINLANDQPLAHKYKDHNLSGNWATYRECHITPDLLLIYSKPCENILKLVRLGSHSNLFD